MAHFSPAGPLSLCTGVLSNLQAITDQLNSSESNNVNSNIQFDLTATAGTLSTPIQQTGVNFGFTPIAGAQTITAVEREWSMEFGTCEINLARVRTGDAFFEITLPANWISGVPISNRRFGFGHYQLFFQGDGAAAGNIQVTHNVAGNQSTLTGFAAGDVFRFEITGTTVSVLKNGTNVHTYAQPANLTDDIRPWFNSCYTAGGTTSDTLTSVAYGPTGSFTPLASSTITVNGITPSIVTPASTVVGAGQSVQLTATPTGGAWSISPNNTGASISLTGLYTASLTNPGGNDTVVYTLPGGCLDTQVLTAYPPLALSPLPVLPATSLFLRTNSTTQFTGSGGSGDYTFFVDNGTVDGTGRYQALQVPGYATLTIRDNVTGEVISVNLVIESGGGLCISAAKRCD